MYCVNCGVKLADTEEKCPLCGVVAYHPDLLREKAEPLYPRQHYPEPQVKSGAAMFILASAFLLPIVLTLLVDLQINKAVTWSGYVVGALLLGYVVVVLPWWFRKPNPVVFVPCDFLAVGLYLLYISLYTGGGWFLSFALPVTGGLGLIVTAVVALLRYVRGGKLYIFGGAAIALGLFMPLVEFLIYWTFHRATYVNWSLFPLTVLLLLGGNLIYLAANPKARESMERKFFI